MFEFQFTLTDEDYIKLNQYNFFHSPMLKRRLIILRWYPPLLLFVIWFYQYTDIQREDIPIVVMLLLLIAIISVIWNVLFKPVLKWQEKRAYYRYKKASRIPFNNQMYVRFQDDFFVRGNGDFESRLKYSLIENIVVANDAVYIYISVLSALIMPFNLFADQNSVNVFIQFLEGKRRQAG